MPVVNIDGNQVEVPKGYNVIQAAQKLGIEIPHYCYHPGLRIDGNCRMCLVEVKGPRGFMPQIACNTQCIDGLEVKTNTDNVKNMRKSVMEFLLHNHPIDCPICDQAGECRLQDYYMKYGKYDNRSIVEKVHKEKVVDVGPLVVLDQERCILCSRCVRFCEDISKTYELVITHRGVESRIEVFPGTEIDNKYSGNVVDICPVGALTSKDFRFKKRVWFLETSNSICMGCSRGCNIYSDHKNGVVYRFRPRANLNVNQYWMCDEGRLSYKKINNNRLLEPLYENQEIEYEEAINKFKNIIKNVKSQHTPKSIIALASAHSSLEDNFMLKMFMENYVGNNKVYGLDFSKLGYEDDFLIKADKTPNRKSFKYLNLNEDKEEFINLIKNKEIKLIISMNNNFLDECSELVKEIKDIKLITMSSHNNKTTEKSLLAIPVSYFSEKFGSYINCDDYLQKCDKMFDTFELNDSLAKSEWELLAQVMTEYDSKFIFNDIEDLWELMSSKVNILEGLSFSKIGENGINLQKYLESKKENLLQV
ncbi:MAG: (2Fe-2S)-binding protein [Candidatus Sericytochromatia bacterium]|nr:MAG: (2Fe-2S)-binding protein [Candidatus Sericytochromatia bacterium]